MLSDDYFYFVFLFFLKTCKTKNMRNKFRMIWRYKVFEINSSSGYYDQLVFVVKKGGWNYLPVGRPGVVAHDWLRFAVRLHIPFASGDES